MAKPDPSPADPTQEWMVSFSDWIDVEELRLSEVELYDFWPATPAPSDYLDRSVRTIRGPVLLGTALDLLALLADLPEEDVLAHCTRDGKPGTLAVNLPVLGLVVVARFRFVLATPQDLEAAGRG